MFLHQETLTPEQYVITIGAHCAVNLPSLQEPKPPNAFVAVKTTTDAKFKRQAKATTGAFNARTIVWKRRSV